MEKLATNQVYYLPTQDIILEYDVTKRVFKQKNREAFFRLYSKDSKEMGIVVSADIDIACGYAKYIGKL